MSHRSVRFLVPLVWAGVALFVRGATAAPAVDEKAIDAIVEQALKAWQVPGAALGIVRGDQVVTLRCFGVREVGKTDAVTPDTLFAIASCTKAFTATAVALLVDEGKMAWDDPVRKHVEFFRLADPLADREVTLRDLLCHRTGLAGGTSTLLVFNATGGRGDLVRRLGVLQPAHSFRAAFEYNNAMYVAAGYAAGVRAQSTWEDLVEQRIFKPLGMIGATSRTAVAQQNENRAGPHRRSEAGEAEPLPWDLLTTGAPTGSIHASVRDMITWLRFQLGDGTFQGNRLLSQASLAEMQRPQMVVRKEGIIRTAYPDSDQVSYGLGWFVHDYRGHALLSHTGGLRGFRARIVLVPAAKLGIVFLMNSGVGSSYASAHYVVTNNLLDVLLGLPKKDWNQYYSEQFKKMDATEKASLARRSRQRQLGTKPSHPLGAYTGTYANPAFGQATVSLQNGVLSLSWGPWKISLGHYHYDTFVDRETKESREMNGLNRELALFTLEADGTVGTLRLFGQEFKRMGAKPAMRVSR
jgi:CubicO group peptidase (beta-lactamase class C family)